MTLHMENKKPWTFPMVIYHNFVSETSIWFHQLFPSTNPRYFLVVLKRKLDYKRRRILIRFVYIWWVISLWSDLEHMCIRVRGGLDLKDLKMYWRANWCACLIFLLHVHTYFSEMFCPSKLNVCICIPHLGLRVYSLGLLCRQILSRFSICQSRLCPPLSRL